MPEYRRFKEIAPCIDEDLKIGGEAMQVWQVGTEGNVINLGGHRRRMLTRQGCNEPFKGSFWCPRRKWFRREPCPFVNKHECNTYYKLCGAL